MASAGSLQFQSKPQDAESDVEAERQPESRRRKRSPSSSEGRKAKKTKKEKAKKKQKKDKKRRHEPPEEATKRDEKEQDVQGATGPEQHPRAAAAGDHAASTPLADQGAEHRQAADEHQEQPAEEAAQPAEKAQTAGSEAQPAKEATHAVGSEAQTAGSEAQPAKEAAHAEGQDMKHAVGSEAQTAGSEAQPAKEEAHAEGQDMKHAVGSEAQTAGSEAQPAKEEPPDAAEEGGQPPVPEAHPSQDPPGVKEEPQAAKPGKTERASRGRSRSHRIPVLLQRQSGPPLDLSAKPETQPPPAEPAETPPMASPVDAGGDSEAPPSTLPPALLANSSLAKDTAQANAHQVQQRVQEKSCNRWLDHLHKLQQDSQKCRERWEETLQRQKETCPKELLDHASQPLDLPGLENALGQTEKLCGVLADLAEALHHSAKSLGDHHRAALGLSGGETQMEKETDSAAKLAQVSTTEVTEHAARLKKALSPLQDLQTATLRTLSMWSQFTETEAARQECLQRVESRWQDLAPRLSGGE